MIATVGVKAHPSKCVFVAREVPYLGHILSADGVRLMEAKGKTITKLSAPVDAAGVSSFMALAGYYRKFVPNVSSVSKPLNELTHANTPFLRTEARQKVFQSLKGCGDVFPRAKVAQS